jgi:hypothetical protein
MEKFLPLQKRELSNHKNIMQKIFYYNLRLVSKPFDRMIYSPDVCEIMGKNYWFFHISVEG